MTALQGVQVSSGNPAPGRIKLGSDIRARSRADFVRGPASWLVGGLSLVLSGCALPYVAHVSYGQARILVGRVSIESRLDDPAVSEKEKAKLRLVVDAKTFAGEEVGLAQTGSYASVYDTEGDPVAWNLSACADDAFLPYRWDFPVLGSMPYKGYFVLAPAIDEARELKAMNMDVLLAPVSAYSTLGWFSDPLFTPMLEDPDEVLVNVILHELAHATIFIEKDADFNETLATFIGNQGSVEYFQKRYGADDPRLRRAEDADHDDKIFAQELAALRAELTALYATKRPRTEKLAEKRRLIAAFRERFGSTIRPTLRTDNYDFVLRRELNNAWILGLERYHGDLELFAKVHRKLGSRLRTTVLKLKEIAKTTDPRASLAALARD